MAWQFRDPPNVAVITSKKIVHDGDWIAYVTHDEDEGGWQFHNREPMSEEDAAVVSLRSIFELDNSVGELADLPLGWHAWRERKDAQWQRSKAT